MTGVAPDGSPVELYARLPTFGEPELVSAALPPGTEILELGAGAGRMTHRLLELGHPVIAVDHAPEMLAHVRDADVVEADIAGLELGRRFGCVLLASQLVNVDDDLLRAALLETCARHVAPGGVVLIQRYDPEWAADPRPSESTREGVTMRVLDPRRDGERLTATIEYELGGETWRHGPFTSRILDEDELAGRLFAAGLLLDHWLDERRTWLAAVRAPDTSALLIEVRVAEPLVAAHRIRWDPSGAVVPAHVTILFPFLDPATIDDAVMAELAGIAGNAEPFELRFEQVGRFPTVTWLAPEPTAPLRALTDAVVDRWPTHPPYGGAHPDVVHHLTVADGAPAAVLDRLERELPAGLPLSTRVTELTLVCRVGGAWGETARFRLGGG